MKTFKIFSLLIGFLSLTSFSFAQEIRTESIKVAGNCSMCKSRIEKAAKTAGVESADWDTETKILVVKYNTSSLDVSRIQKAIAAVGHDTPDFKASEETYNKLPSCCKYERMKSSGADMSHQMDCCRGEKSEHLESHSVSDDRHVATDEKTKRIF